MSKVHLIASRAALASLCVCGAMSAATVAGDLSQYRGIRLGTDLPTVAKQVGATVSQAKVIHSRPALIEELAWRPRSLGPSSQPESVSDVLFTFYNGELYRIAVNYDRYEIEGLTAEDIIGAVSLVYGPAAKPAAPAKVVQDLYGAQEEVVACWQDSQYNFDLIRSSDGPSFKLIGVMKRLEAPAEAAGVEAKRLDDQEAPQRDAARAVSEQEAARAKLEKSRLVNVPRFRP
jgi:hypothetical protein